MKKNFAIFGYLLFTISMHPMQQSAARTIGQRIIKPLISKAATAAHWGISYGPFLGQGLLGLGAGIYDKELCDWVASKDPGIDCVMTHVDGSQETIYRDYKYFSEADACIQDFEVEQARKIGLKKTPSVRIAPSIFLSCPAGAYNNVIFVNANYTSHLKDAINTQDKEVINQWKAVFQHENGHIKNHDMLSGGVAYLTMPLLNHKLIKIGKKALPFTYKITSFVGMQCAKIASGVGKYFYNDLQLKQMRRIQEQRADDGVSNDIDTLQGLRSFFINNEENPRSIKDHLFHSHPSHAQRIAKIDERIEKLKKQSNA